MQCEYIYYQKLFLGISEGIVLFMDGTADFGVKISLSHNSFANQHAMVLQIIYRFVSDH